MATRQPARRSTEKPTNKPTTRKTAAKTLRPKAPAGMKEISPEAIRKRAYEIFRARGGRHGQDLDDWFQAEQELRGPRKR